jgi:hypothetical protein
MIARLKFPRIGIFAYQSKFVGKSQNRFETIWIFPHMTFTVWDERAKMK